MKTEFRNIVIATAANAVGLCVSVINTGFVPKFITDIDYGYFQLYLFYIGYVGFFHFGLQDGIYLRYGGQEYDALDKKLFHSELVILVVFESLLALAVFCLAGAMSGTGEKAFILRMFGLCCLIYLPATTMQYILLMTNRIKDYSKSLFIEKLTYAVLLTACICLQKKTFRYYVYADLLSKVVALVYISFQCRDMVWCKGVSVKTALVEAFSNCRVGMLLLLANISGLLLVGIPRFFIEGNWDIAVFAQAGITLALCNFMLTFLLAVGQVLFPVLKRANPEELPQIYGQINRLVSVMSAVILMFYPVIRLLVEAWLPKYAQGIGYMGILLPMCVYEIKTSILLTVYFKVLRKEKMMLLLNLPALAVCLVFSILGSVVLHNLKLVLFTIVLACGCRSVLAQFYLMKTMGVHEMKAVLTDIIIAIVFIAGNALLSPKLASIVYLITAVSIIALFYRQEIRSLRASFSTL